MKRCLMIALTLFCLCLQPHPLSAEETIDKEQFLDQGERILDELRVSEDYRELYTEKEGIYYKKILIKRQEDWKQEGEEQLELPLGGLKTRDEGQGSPLSEEALHEELYKLGHNPAALPARLDYAGSPYLPPVGEQFEDSCVGWSVGYYLRSYQEAREKGYSFAKNVKADPKRVFSPTFIYNQINEGVDEGSTLQDAGKLLESVGAAKLADFPYIPEDYLTQPNTSVKDSAYPHRIRDFRILFTKNDSAEYKLRKIKEYLMTEDLPIIGIKIGLKWKSPYMDANGNSIITREHYFRGGHAVVIVGYDDDLRTPDGVGAFKILNSYGEKWGNQGYSYLSYEAFTNAVLFSYIYTDLETPDAQTLQADIRNSVEFQSRFRGSGHYDLNIRDLAGNLVRAAENLPIISGEAAYLWDGLDTSGVEVLDGKYALQLLSKGKLLHASQFEKKSALKNSAVSKIVDKNGDGILRVELLTDKDATIDLRQGTKLLLQGKVTGGEESRFFLRTSRFDQKEPKLTIEVY